MTNAAPNNVLEYQLFTLIKLNFFQNYALAQFTPLITIRITITITTIVIEVGNEQEGMPNNVKKAWSQGQYLNKKCLKCALLYLI